jgi:hypothetical protein
MTGVRGRGLGLGDEREFFGLATDWLLCRGVLMGHRCTRVGQTYDVCAWQVGELATGVEMRLLLREVTA